MSATLPSPSPPAVPVAPPCRVPSCRVSDAALDNDRILSEIFGSPTPTETAVTAAVALACPTPGLDVGALDAALVTAFTAPRSPDRAAARVLVGRILSGIGVPVS